MYIYKFVISFVDGSSKTDWVTGGPGESVASLKDRAERFVDDLESRTDVSSVHMTRRLVPGI